MAATETYVIVGAGLAGAKTAEALRGEGFDGPIVLLGEEPEQPYERPPLSKDYLRGESLREKAHVHPEHFYAANDIDLRTETSAIAVDTRAREVVLADGTVVRYSRLLLATGAKPRRLRLPGTDLRGIHYLRDLRDADRLRRRLRPGASCAVIGGGWIGAEVAASARQLGAEVSIVAPSALPLERVLGRQVAQVYASIHEDQGVRLITGAEVTAFDGTGAVECVRLSDGRTLWADFVVVGVGVAPRVELADHAGLATDNGILVSQRLETSHRHVYAAGDVANAYHPFYRRRLRVEHWANALNQPATAARAMLGKPASYDRLPYFFSDQYDVGMEYTGYAERWDQVVFRGDPDEREFIAFYLDHERVVAAANVNVWDVADPIRSLIRQAGPVDVAELRDPDVPLARLAQTGGLETAA